MVDEAKVDALIRRFNPEQPRGEHGRWISGMGSGGDHAEPVPLPHDEFSRRQIEHERDIQAHENPPTHLSPGRRHGGTVGLGDIGAAVDEHLR